MAHPRANIHREPMAKVDTAWLRMERPTNLMMITGVLTFATPLELDALKDVIAERFLAYPRFAHKAVDRGGSAHWESDPDFDLDWHVRLTALPGAAEQAELEQLVSQLASTPLDPSKPLWQFHLVERYRGGSAVIARIHHCYADGMALVQVLLSLTDVRARRRAARLAEAWLERDAEAQKPSPSSGSRRRSQGRAQFDAAVKAGGRVIERGVDMYRDPQLLAVLAKDGSEIARELADALLLADDPPTSLRGSLGVSKRCSWAPPLSLDDVKAVGKALGATVNDVLLACAAGALREELLGRGDAIDGCAIRATVPVNLRPLNHARKLGNHFGLVFLDLPIGEPNPLVRLEAVAAHMRELKSSRQAIVAYGLLASLGVMPQSIQKRALELLSRKATAVATNVPGPPMPLYLAGQEISELMFWVPQTGTIGIGLSILSYDGAVYFGLIADAKLVPEPRAIVERFAGEFEKLVLATLLVEWQQPIDTADITAMVERLDAADA